MDFHFATAWELIADAVPDALALVCGDDRVTWREMDDRASRLAGFLTEQGLGPGSKVALYLHNCNEHLEAQFAAFKIRGTPINVNYRYTADELVYLLDDSDSEAVFFDAAYADKVASIRGRLPKVTCWIERELGGPNEPFAPAVGDVTYSAALSSSPMERIDRPDDDVYLFYTGGTTGMPKGVMLHIGQFCEYTMPVFRGRGARVPETVEELPASVRELHDSGMVPVCLPACPLIHGTGMWMNAMPALFQGGVVVTLPGTHLDADRLWGEVERHRVTDLAIVGDAFGRPLLAALDAAAEEDRSWDLSSLFQILSSGAMWSSDIKRGLLRHLDVRLYDSLGSTESDVGRARATRDSSETEPTARFRTYEGVKVIDAEGLEVGAGSGEIGQLIAPGWVPLGYYKDPKKTARTIREIDGVRYSFTGDWARPEADGSITLVGRGSGCINTGGEKVYPEEVEEVLKSHSEISDCLVVGLPDDRFGERVTAVASLANGSSPPEPESLLSWVRERLAPFKVPKRVHFVTQVPRKANGKADYAAARGLAIEEER